jgi:hypothetical protein
MKAEHLNVETFACQITFAIAPNLISAKESRPDYKKKEILNEENLNNPSVIFVSRFKGIFRYCKMLTFANSRLVTVYTGTV